MSAFNDASFIDACQGGAMLNDELAFH